LYIRIGIIVSEFYLLKTFMNRKQFLVQSGIFFGGLFISQTISCVGSEPMKTVVLTNLQSVLDELNILEKSKSITVPGDWDVNQVFHHCAQSIEFSLVGYPVEKTKFFQNTVGKIVLKVFLAKGSMNHSLVEPIPGAPTLPEKNPHFSSGLERLRKSIQDFQNFSGDLSPHFVYGRVSKQDYEQVHAMHIANHLSSFQY
jgi:hypothetical protein